ncbi:hypothetical protein Q3G72_017725 [Acer saccharum]|nr:hypothetical protein Q3G72_017725 [Acer saccharum]
MRFLQVDVLGDGEETLMPIQYERLPSFCFQCGVVGHTIWGCPEFNSQRPIGGEDFQYGAWLRAAVPAKKVSQWGRGYHHVGGSSGGFRRSGNLVEEVRASKKQIPETVSKLMSSLDSGIGRRSPGRTLSAISAIDNLDILGGKSRDGLNLNLNSSGDSSRVVEGCLKKRVEACSVRKDFVFGSKPVNGPEVGKTNTLSTVVGLSPMFANLPGPSVGVSVIHGLSVQLSSVDSLDPGVGPGCVGGPGSSGLIDIKGLGESLLSKINSLGKQNSPTEECISSPMQGNEQKIVEGSHGGRVGQWKKVARNRSPVVDGPISSVVCGKRKDNGVEDGFKSGAKRHRDDSS